MKLKQFIFASMAMLLCFSVSAFAQTPALPNAEVINLGGVTVGPGEETNPFNPDSYYIYDLVGGSGLQSGVTDPFDLQIAMQFKAKDTAEEAENNYYADYTTDFFIQMTGISGGEFKANGCYLAGYYPSFGAWVKIPLDGFTVKENQIYPVITSAGFDFKYTDICGSVKDFICGIYLTPEVLAANPNLKVDLSLGLSENVDEALNGNFTKVDNYTYDVDDLNGVVAKIGETKYTTLSKAFAAVKDDAQTVVVLKDVTEELTGAYLRGNITTENDAKVTIQLTNSNWVNCPYTFVVGENITLKVPALFYYAGGSQINGTVIADAYYQRYAGTKLTINEPGSMTVTGETCILRYVDGDANAGIYVNGDKNPETVGLNLAVAYFYQGMINAKDANIQAGVYWQTNETDGQGSANLVLDNSTLNVTVNEHDFKATGNSTVTLKNGSVINAAGGFNAATVTIDAENINATTTVITSTKKPSIETVDVINNDRASCEITENSVVIKYNNTLEGAGTAESPFLIKSADDLVFFRNSVNNGETTYSAPGVYVALAADIDLKDENWVGIGSAYADHGFMGNFDGKGFKIKNLTITDPTLDSDGYVYAGLFSVTEGIDKDNQNTIKNLIIENVTINTTGHIVSAAIAYPYYTIVDNVKVCGNIAITGGDYTAGVLAYTRRCVNASNLSIEGNEGSSVTGNQVVGGVISDIQMNGGLIADYSNFSAQGITVTGKKMVGGISGIIATQTLDGATVKNVVLNSEDDFAGLVAGRLGGTSTISNVESENVTGATAVIGATYDGAMPIEAKIDDTYFSTVEGAMASNVEGVVDLLTDLTLNDSEDYTFTKQARGNVTYTRTFANSGVWNAMYLPVAIPMSAIDPDKYEIAYINDVHSEDLNGDGQININQDKMWMEVVKITNNAATLTAYGPYVIKAKTDEAKNFELTLENVTVKAAEEIIYDCSSMSHKFNIQGTCRKRTKDELAGGYVVSTKGGWVTSTSAMKPFRFYMTITDRWGNPVNVDASESQLMRIKVRGEEDTTEIDGVECNTNSVDQIFDLQGRRVATPVKGGIYIVNGKKVLFNK